LTFLAALTILSSVTLNATAAENNLTILSHTGYLDPQGNYHVVGEVQNIGSQTVNFVQIEATFYDPQNHVIDTRFDLTMLYTILPDRKSPFLIALLDVAQSAKVHHYSLTTSFLLTSPIPIGLQILSHNSQTDTQGRIHITGQIKNIETSKAHNIKIVATCYDVKGKVVAAALTDLDPIEDDLNPNQTRPFEIIINQQRAPLIYTYELTAESLEYAIIPEHPTLTHAPLLTAILTLALTTHKNVTNKNHNTKKLQNP